jgi:hypothetical protein
MISGSKPFVESILTLYVRCFDRYIRMNQTAGECLPQDVVLALSRLIAKVGETFDDYMPQLQKYILIGLRNYEDVHVYINLFLLGLDFFKNLFWTPPKSPKSHTRLWIGTERKTRSKI